MLKIFAVILSVLFILAVAFPVFTQEVRPVEIRLIIEQRLAEDGFYLGNPGFPDGLRYIRFESDSQVSLWGLGGLKNIEGEIKLPLDAFTRSLIDLSDPYLKVTLDEHNRLLGRLIDTCLAVGYPEKTLESDVIFWLLEGKRKRP